MTKIRLQYFIQNAQNKDCKLCKNLQSILYYNIVSERCRKFTYQDKNNDKPQLEHVFLARKDDSKCGMKGKYFEEKIDSMGSL